MYRALYDQAQLDILEAITEGRLHPLKVLSQGRRGKEIMLPSEEVLESLRALAQ